MLETGLWNRFFFLADPFRIRSGPLFFMRILSGSIPDPDPVPVPDPLSLKLSITKKDNPPKPFPFPSDSLTVTK